MKTIWIINQYSSTPETGWAGRSYYLASELAKQGYRVYLIASAAHHLLRKRPTCTSKFTIESRNLFTFVWVKMPSYSEAHSKLRVLSWFLFPWCLQKLEKAIPHQPDVILCSSPSLLAFLGAHRLAKKYHSRLVFEVRDIWPLTLTEIGGYSSRHPFIRFMQWVEDRAYRKADVVVSNLKNSVEHMVSRGMRREKFAWIPNGYSQDEVSHAKLLSPGLVSQIPKGKFIVGYAGTFGLANDLYTLIEAAEKLKDISGIAFVLVGGGKEKSELVRYANNKNLKNVTFIDFIEKKQIQTMLSYFDILTVAAKKDPMYRFGVSPNKLFDYLYSGKPIIYAIDSGDYKPVEEAGAGFHVSAQDAKKLADAVLALYKMSPVQRKKMGNKGRKLAIEQYEYGQLALQYRDVLFPEDSL
jgi:glycosyltransferase involved in cell wall biosynthesis